MTYNECLTLHKLMSEENRSRDEEKRLTELFKAHVTEEFDITIDHIIEELDDDEYYNAGDELQEQMAQLLGMWCGCGLMNKEFDKTIATHIHFEFSSALNYLINYYREDDDD